MRTLIFALGFWFTSGLFAQANKPDVPRAYPLHQLLNLYVAQYAYEHLEWQRDIRLEGNRAKAVTIAQTQPGRYIGDSSFFGAYTYKPAAFSGLTEPQKRAVLDSPQLKAWLDWFGNRIRLVGQAGEAEIQVSTIPPPEPVIAASVELGANYGKYSYKLKPDEMLSTKPLHLKLQP